MFGFTVYNSIYQNSRERFLEKHVGVIARYNDQTKIKNAMWLRNYRSTSYQKFMGNKED